MKLSLEISPSQGERDKKKRDKAESTQWYDTEKEVSPIQRDIQTLIGSGMHIQMFQMIPKTRCFETNLSVYGPRDRI